MNEHPYNQLPPSAFWRTGVSQENPNALKGIYTKKYTIRRKTKIATSGSCFAQHIARHLLKRGYKVLDLEPPPPGLPSELHLKYGFSTYSARYGNIYTTRHLLQLAREAAGEWSPADWIWERDGRFYDAFRPSVEPKGLGSPDEVIAHRKYHIEKTRQLFKELDLFIFTLGLTEMWVHKETGTAYPAAPGVIAGQFDPTIHIFKNAEFNEVVDDFNTFRKTVKKIRGGRPFRILLTVSPVPLTATASGSHVLASSTYSKAVLRAAAGKISAGKKRIDYFPSYEIATNPKLRSTSFSDNLRSIKDEAVDMIMDHFFSVHSNATIQPQKPITPLKERAATKMSEIALEKIQCEESLLDAFGQ